MSFMSSSSIRPLEMTRPPDSRSVSLSVIGMMSVAFCPSTTLIPPARRRFIAFLYMNGTSG